MRVVTITKVFLIMFHLPHNSESLGENLVEHCYGEHNEIKTHDQGN